MKLYIYTFYSVQNCNAYPILFLSFYDTKRESVVVVYPQPSIEPAALVYQLGNLNSTVKGKKKVSKMKQLIACLLNMNILSSDSDYTWGWSWKVNLFNTEYSYL